MGDTKIEWTNKTWNPIRARNKATGKVGWFCEHVSEGCRNCYAEKMNRNTYFGNGLDYKPAVLDQVELFLDEKILEQPLHWRKPVNVFPCSMTDLFGRWVPDEWIDRIFAVMGLAKRHTFQCLTKRPERMRDYMNRSGFADRVYETARHYGSIDQLVSLANLLHGPDPIKELPNVWLGTSCEDQKTADERIPLLLQTPAAVRWISAEPLLGPISLAGTRDPKTRATKGSYLSSTLCAADGSLYERPPLDWVVVGGESGPRARPMHPDWARSLRDQCVAAGVPFFFKQWGEWLPGQNDPLPSEYQKHGHNQRVAHWQDGGWGLRKPRSPLSNYAIFRPDGSLFQGFQTEETRGEVSGFAIRAGKKAAGRLLDGREWNQFPESKAVTA